ncbi:MAG: hypothetical protein WBM04_09815 [Candidatus Korobacteraceae bacterium]
MCVESQYCSYTHLSAMLDRTGADWLIAMFEAYFDDSGTDHNSEIAVAACYVSTKRGWDDFVKAWDNARWEEGFEAFHMADFLAPSEQQRKPWCEWDDTKKDHVYKRLANIVNENKRIGIAAAVPKSIWDSTPEHIRQCYGREHYTFAVRYCILRIAEWRKKSLISLPVQYVFDWEMEKTPKRIEISKILDTMAEYPSVAQAIGLELGGYGFQHKEKFKPLQAADILAWQMRNHMRKIWPLGHDDPELCHPGFRQLREDQEMNLVFFTEENIHKFVRDADALAKESGQALPILYP